MSCVPWSYLVLSCAGFCRFGLLLSWLLLSSSSVVSSCRVPCCLVFSSLGPSVLSLGASWKPLRRLWGDLLGLREPSGGLLRPIVALLTGLGASRIIRAPVPGRPWALLGGPWAALGSSWLLLGLPWAALGRSWAAPEALLAPPGRLLGPSGRLESRVLPKSRISSTVQRFSWFFGGPGGLLAPPGALLEPSWRPLGPSWRLLGRPSCSWVALGWLLAGPSGSRVVLGWPWPWPQWARDRAQRRGPREPVPVHCIDI